MLEPGSFSAPTSSPRIGSSVCWIRHG